MWHVATHFCISSKVTQKPSFMSVFIFCQLSGRSGNHTAHPLFVNSQFFDFERRYENYGSKTRFWPGSQTLRQP